MIQALRVVWRGIVQFEHYGWLYIAMTLLTTVLSIPIITAPAAYAGLCHFSYTAQTNLTASLSDYWEGFRAQLGRGLVVGVANVTIFGMLWSNFNYYTNQSGPLIVVLRGIWVAILVIMIGVEFYLWPILDAMEHPNLREGLRNALVMVLVNPIFTLILLFAALLLIIISVATIAPLALITWGLLACLSTAAVIDRFERYSARHSQSPIGGTKARDQRTDS